MSEIEELIYFIKTHKEICLDLETTGLDSKSDKIITYQIGNDEVQFAILENEFSILEIYNLLKDKLIIGHNIKFDLKFLLEKGIVLDNIYDTYICELILRNGYNLDNSLKGLCKRYLNVDLDKSFRRNISSGVYDIEALKEYGKGDVRYLLDIKRCQDKLAIELDLDKAIKLNNKFVPIIAYLEYSGFRLDKDKWIERTRSDEKDLLKLEKEIKRYIFDSKITNIPGQLNLFTNEIDIDININSVQQMRNIFRSFGIHVDTLNANELEKIDHPLINIYLKYKELSKRVSTYGMNWLNFIKSDGRIYPQYQQFMNTGRMSSGSGGNSPNAQNIPSDDEIRSCIIPDEGNIFINSDYDSQEVRVFTNFCKDRKLVEMFNNGYDDMHSYTAWHIYPQIRNILPELNKDTLKRVKELFPDLRKISKFGNFAIQYGGNEHTIASNCNIDLDDAKNFYDNYFKEFSGVKEYFNWVYKRAIKLGYIQYNNITKEKFFLTSTLDEKKIRNMALNYPIQGSSASITKLAGLLYYKHLIEYGLLFKVKINIICHDEFLIEVPVDLAEQESFFLKKSMEDAGNYYCDVVKLTASPKITKFWKH